MKKLSLILVGTLVISTIFVGCGSKPANNVVNTAPNNNTNTIQSSTNGADSNNLKKPEISNGSAKDNSQNEQNTNKDKNNGENTFALEQAFKLVKDTYYEGKDEKGLVNDGQYETFKPNTYVISLKADFGTGLISTVQSYLIVNGKVISTLTDDKEYWNRVESYKVK